MDKKTKGQMAYNLLMLLLIEKDYRHVKRTRHENVKIAARESRTFDGGYEFLEALLGDITESIFFGIKVSRFDLLEDENKWDVAYGVLVRLMANCNGKFCTSRFETMRGIAKSLYRDDGLEFARFVGHDFIDYAYSNGR